MQTYWLKFTDGSTGYCDGRSPYDAVVIAEKLTGKTVDLAPEHKYNPAKSPNVRQNPYPVSKMIWQFDHPVHGKCPAFCYGGAKCIGRGSCPQSHACSE